KLLKDDDSAVRYWAVLGLRMRGAKVIATQVTDLRKALEDSSPHVRIAAGEALVLGGEEADAKPALATLISLANWEKNDVFVTTSALRALDDLGEKAASVKEEVGKLPSEGKVPDARYRPYVPALLKHLKAP